MKNDLINFHTIKKKIGDFRGPQRLQEYPAIILVAQRHDLLKVVNTEFERVFLKAKTIEDRILIESILTVAFFSCDHHYCYIRHAEILLELGLDVEAVKSLTELYQLPKNSKHSDRWNSVLKVTLDVSKSNFLTKSNQEFVKNILSTDEFDDYIHILSLAFNLKHILLSFKDEVCDIEEQKLLNEKEQIKREVGDLIKYFDYSDTKSKIPVIAMCTFCKDVRNSEGTWLPVEMAFALIDSNSKFSHSICEPCLNKHIPQYVDKLSELKSN